MTLEPDDSNEQYVLRPLLLRGAEKKYLDSSILLTDTIVLGADNRAASFDSTGSRMWLEGLRADNLRVSKTEGDSLVTQLLELPGSFNLDLPSELQFERVRLAPLPHLIIRKPEYEHWANAELSAELRFHYGKGWLRSLDRRPGIYDSTEKRFFERDREAEDAASATLKGLGFKLRGYYDGKNAFYLQPRKLPKVVPALIQRGWKVEAEGKLYRNAGTSNLSVSSGIDWFELHGSVSFGDGLDVKLPVLLSALRKGETMIALGDGSFGLMPQEWLERYGLLTSLGEVEGDHVRFKQTQTGVLDALLAARPEITCDESFARVRQEWQNFKGIKPVKEPAGFIGELRDYQREGLGWFEFLQRFKFGGCLADDMGLGKTVQVLALLESRRNSHNKNPKPSLVVVPRSLIFNWEQEAERFTPRIRVLTHTGSDRAKKRDHFEKYDLILITYGTLRRDAIHFQEVEFDFVILDEAQAIKNSKTESAKAVRLLRGNHRLALSGTPIENHLGELWSLFDFLNPGMLGTASVFQASTNGGRSPDEETRQLLSRALRPFLLRRTKQQVATELPEKLEQTIFCEMEESQRRQYSELRDYYRSSLLKEIELVGLKRSKIQILEALLRLRQVACHPDLIQGNKGGTSTKLDVLLPQLAEVTEEGHKALVFSQFTSFLSIVRKRLEEQGIDYEYLDGKTRDRQAPVERFQNDPNCKLFLVSLKAGGQGLNLTAADYVFLLDPWWNPAVEAQAIDRAHRIGQSRRVFAYRLITRDTVEEKVLALQSTKRELADAIINADNSILKNITGDDLLLLLS
jgi:superfamily II DNA or RNA helicase